MTPAQAARVVAGIEPGLRIFTWPRPDQRCLDAPREVAELLLPAYVERFGIVTGIVSTGTLDASLVNPCEVFRTAA